MRPSITRVISGGTARSKVDLLEPARMLHRKGYVIYATDGTQRFLADNGVPAIRVHLPGDDKQPQALEMLHNKEIDLVVNIPKNLTPKELSNGYKVRRAAIDLNIPLGVSYVDPSTPVSDIKEQLSQLDTPIPVGFGEFNSTIYFDGAEYSEFE